MIKVETSEPIKRLTNNELLNMYVGANNDILQTDGKELFCTICEKSISFETKYLVHRHLKSKKHQKINYVPGDCNNKHFREEKEKLLSLKKSQNFCKTCMKQLSKKDNKQDISEKPNGSQLDTTVMEVLTYIQPQLSVEVKCNFPTFICSDCLQKLIVTYEFIKMYQNSYKRFCQIIDKHGEQVEEIEINKCGYETGEEQFEVNDVRIQVLSKNAENEGTVFSNNNNDTSDYDWTPKKSCLNISNKKHNSDEDDVTKKVFKGFFQPEENEDGSLTCHLCESVLDGILPWRKHIRQNHLEEKPKRAYNRRTKEPRKKGTQMVHRKMLPNEKGLYECEYCEKSYPKYLYYRRHLRIHTEGTHLCIECGKSFSNITSYNSHMLRHKGEKIFECSQCPKSFVCPSDLYGHRMTHTNNKPYVCDICGSAFRMPYQLRNHNRVHTGIKNYKCDYCDMRFKSRPNQVCHMRTHTGEKPFQCKYCERAFAQSGDCVKHMRQHFGDKNVYQCDFCPLRFPLVRDLRTHFASHKDDDDETRHRNLQARMEEEQCLKMKLESKKIL